MDFGMNCFLYFREQILKVLQSLQAKAVFPADLSFEHVAVEPPKNAEHGELSTNAAMVLSKACGMSPRQLAEILQEEIKQLKFVTDVSIAGPGFINISLNPEFWHLQLKNILKDRTEYGTTNLGNGQSANVEYVSVNPTGPMHAGHGRVAIVGDAMARLMEKVGYSVTKEYYVNDGGGQAITLAKSTYLRYLEALGEDIGEIPQGLYPGDYLKAVGQALAQEYGAKWKNEAEDDRMSFFQEYSVNAMMDLIRKDLDLISIKHDVFSSENKLVNAGKVEEVVKRLEKKGYVYTGVLDVPKGVEVDDYDSTPQLLFKSTEFGDDVDRVLQKSNGEWTYFAKDIAYHYDKYQRGFKTQVNIWGADHAGYIKRIISAVKAISNEEVSLTVKTCQMVNFMQNGEALKMSKRDGTFITLEDVVKAVGPDVVRFVMLMRRNDAMLDFDFEKVKEQSKDNPVFYVQYAHARIHSVLRQAKEIMPEFSEEDINQADFSYLSSKDELAMIRLLAGWPRLIQMAATCHEPHRIGGYIYDIAAEFHSLWNKGKEDATLRFIIQDKGRTLARLALLKSIAYVIASGLDLFGVAPLKEMR